MHIVKNFIIGIVIGVANIIPGVSGGTMAVVLGIYDKLISSITNFFKNLKENIIFLATIVIGAGIGILLFANIIRFCLDKYNQQTNFFFIGLIVGTIPLMYKKATEKRVNKLNILWCILAFILTFLMAFLGEPQSNGEIITTISANNIFKLFFAGFIAAAAMILPGVSGSFILLLLGLYDSIISAIADFNIKILFVVGVGVGCGLLVMTKVIDILFKRYPQTAYFIILGLILGSIYAIFPGISISMGSLISIITFVIGFGIAFVMGKRE